MKVCTKCNIEKDESEFYRDYRYEGFRYKSFCKECWAKRQAEYRKTHKTEISESNKKYYSEHKEESKLKASKWREANRDKIAKQAHDRLDKIRKVLDEKKVPCLKCGEDRLYLIQFHHVNPKDKRFEVNGNIVKKYTEAEVDEEIKKCVCLCPTCHFEFHYFYGMKPKEPQQALKDYLEG